MRLECVEWLWRAIDSLVEKNVWFPSLERGPAANPRGGGAQLVAIDMRSFTAPRSHPPIVRLKKETCVIAVGGMLAVLFPPFSISMAEASLMAALSIRFLCRRHDATVYLSIPPQKCRRAFTWIRVLGWGPSEKSGRVVPLEFRGRRDSAWRNSESWRRQEENDTKMKRRMKETTQKWRGWKFFHTKKKNRWHLSFFF